MSNMKRKQHANSNATAQSATYIVREVDNFLGRARFSKKSQTWPARGIVTAPSTADAATEVGYFLEGPFLEQKKQLACAPQCHSTMCSICHQRNWLLVGTLALLQHETNAACTQQRRSTKCSICRQRRWLLFGTLAFLKHDTQLACTQQCHSTKFSRCRQKRFATFWDARVSKTCDTTSLHAAISQNHLQQMPPETLATF